MAREYLENGAYIELSAGQQTGESKTWEILAKVGEGASSVCYEAMHNNKKGKLKCFDPIQKNADYSKMSERFLRPYILLEEIKKQNSKNELLNNYIPYYEILYDNQDEKKLYIWTPSDKQGIVFSEYLKEVRNNPLTDAEKKCSNIIQTLISVSDGVCLLHSAGLLHLDIKPSNILVCCDSADEINPGSISLFDIDTICSIDDPITTFSGSKGFCAPEISFGSADWKADIYSLGAMLFNATVIIEGTGNGLFIDTYYDEIDALVNSSKLIEALEIPDKAAFKIILGHIFKKTLARNTNQRYEDCEELIQELKFAKAYIDAINTPPELLNAKKEKVWCFSCMQRNDEGNDTCAFCGRMLKKSVPVEHLQPGTVLHNKYMVGYALGQGGFGITYIGYDKVLDMRVAVKEYFPNGLANRVNYVDATVSCGTEGGDRRDIFDTGKDRFLKEARTLAKFSGQSGIVDVREFFEENNTAYIVMEYLEGRTLKELLHERGTFTVYDIVQMLEPVMDSLKRVHKQGLIHRDISPDNIMLIEDRVKLLDFGAARDVIEGGERSLSVMLKPGYAPEEQYRSRGIQGPWTDVYALAATIYKCITGITPDESIQRTFSDELKKPSELGIQITGITEEALMKGLAVYSKDRYQTVDEFLAGLKSGLRDEDKTVRLSQPIKKTAVSKKSKNGLIAVIALAGIILCATVLFLISRMSKSNDENKDTNPPSEQEAYSDTAEDEKEINAVNNEPTDANNDYVIEEPHNVTIGSRVCFGNYEQDNNTENGKEKIVWQVVDIKDDRALLISSIALECRPYNGKQMNISWEFSKLRKWLNEDFYISSFSEKEQGQIFLSDIETSKNGQYGTENVRATQDKIFILSAEEVGNYWPNLEGVFYNVRNMIGTSLYAISNGVEVAQPEEYDSYFGLVPEEIVGSCKWWLRTPGESMEKAAYVQTMGTISYKGAEVQAENIAVRPAVWVSYEAIENRKATYIKVTEKSDYIVWPDENQGTDRNDIDEQQPERQEDSTVNRDKQEPKDEDVNIVNDDVTESQEVTTDNGETGEQQEVTAIGDSEFEEQELQTQETEDITEEPDYGDIVFDISDKSKVENEYGISGSYTVLNNLIDKSSITANDIGVHYDFEGGNNEIVNNLFDGDLNTKYCALDGDVVGTNAEYRIQFALTQKAAIKGYVLFTANDTREWETRNPDSWKIYGSNDSEAENNNTWNLIKAETGGKMRAVDCIGFGYPIDNSNKYKYYKIVFSEKIDNTQTIQLADILLLGE